MHRGVIGVPHKVISETQSSYQIKKEVSGFQMNLDTAVEYEVQEGTFE